jgi:hypothetical protein
MNVHAQRKLAKLFCWTGGSCLVAITAVWVATADADRLLAQARIVAGSLHQNREAVGGLCAALGVGLASVASATTLAAGVVGLLTTHTTPPLNPTLPSPAIREAT